MTFLQPWVLAGLPLVVLPLIIHLINQRRFQTVPWAAMRFLLAARALSRGYSRLRHWLIMALRMLAVAAVILAVGRPLSRGWLALAAGGRPDSAIVILDRSPSMQAVAAAGGASKLDTGRRQLAAALATLRAGRVMLLSDPGRGPEEVAAPDALVELATAGPLASAADVPALVQSAYEYIREQAAGTTEIWICSDQRGNDWKPDDGGWPGIRDALAKLPQQVRVQLLSYAAPARGNIAVRVSGVRLETLGRDRRLVVSVTV
ncbi:MAG: BatA domain-containing protein, partial [Planctomycetota bacterium]